MLSWFAIYTEKPQSEALVEKSDSRQSLLERFDLAANEGKIERSPVRGMWLIDHITEQEDVIRVWKSVPGRIVIRRHAYLRTHNK